VSIAQKCIGQVIVGRAETWIVEEVEELAPETQAHLFCRAKLPLQCKISLPGPEAPQHVASQIALLAGGRRSKDSVHRQPGLTTSSWQAEAAGLLPLCGQYELQLSPA
jgi:hypothetical protein